MYPGGGDWPFGSCTIGSEGKIPVAPCGGGDLPSPRRANGSPGREGSSISGRRGVLSGDTGVEAARVGGTSLVGDLLNTLPRKGSNSGADPRRPGVTVNVAEGSIWGISGYNLALAGVEAMISVGAQRSDLDSGGDEGTNLVSENEPSIGRSTLEVKAVVRSWECSESSG